MIRGGHDSAAFPIAGVVEPSRIFIGERPQGGVGLGRQHKKPRLGLGAGLGARRISDHHMGARPAEPERAHSRETRLSCSRQRRRLPSDDQIEARKVDVRVWVFKMKRARRLVVLERKHRLQKAGKSRNGFGVSDVGFDGPDRQRTRAGVPEHLAERGRFHRVARSRSRSVSLDIGHRIRRDPGPVVDGAQKLDLSLLGRQGDAARTPVRIDAAAADDRMDPVAVRHRPLERFQDEDDAALRADVAVGLGGECTAKPGRRKHGRLGKADKLERACQDVHAADQRGVDLATSERMARFVKSNERRGTCRVESHARPTQIENV